MVCFLKEGKFKREISFHKMINECERQDCLSPMMRSGCCTVQSLLTALTVESDNYLNHNMLIRNLSANDAARAASCDFQMFCVSIKCGQPLSIIVLINTIIRVILGGLCVLWVPYRTLAICRVSCISA